MYFHTFHVAEAGDVMNTGNQQSYYDLHRPAAAKQNKADCALRLAVLVLLQPLIAALTAWMVRVSM